jgi:hypothetical protein
MNINYCTYNTRTNIIIDKDLSSWEEALSLAAKYPEWCIASNTIEDKLTGSEWATEEFFNCDNI